jgi:syntaxin 1B/2/3
MIELAELFQDLDTLVLQQDVQVKIIEEKGEEIQENIVKGNEELDTGIKKARAARKKKWICFWLTVIIVLAIAGGVAAYVLITNKAKQVASSPQATQTVTAAAAGPTATKAKMARLT